MKKKLLSVFVLALLSIGCSTMKVPAKVTHPAEVNMTSHKKIAVMDIAGNYGDSFRDAIKARLSSSGQFEVQNCASNIRMVETTEEVTTTSPKKLNKVGKAIAIAGILSSGQANLSGASNTRKHTVTKKVAVKELPEECKLENLVVSAFVKGNYNGKFQTNLESSKATCKKDDKEYACFSYKRTGSVSIEGSIDVVNTETGGIIATKQIRDVCSDSSWSKESKPREIDERGLKNTCVNRNATLFARTLTPWTETVMVAYQKDGDLPQLEQGIKLVELGRYEKAIEIFSAAIKDAERNNLKPKIIAKAYWNLGLAYEYSWQFQNALDTFDKGYLVHSDKKFLKEIANTENLKAKREKLLKQNQAVVATQ